MPAILITGASSGYGLETARHFLARDWRVIATMRRPDASPLPASDRLTVLPLDVTDENSIAACITDAGPIDVLVNNAGIGVVGAFEATPMDHIRKVFDTNTFGVMALCQAVIPQMRARRSGVIVNITSSVTLAAMPLAAAYKASKEAIEGFTESLALELGHFDVKARLVEPGYAPTTRFTANTTIDPMSLIPETYQGFAGPIFAAFAQPLATTRESDVAEAVWAAAHDTTGRLRFPAGADAVALFEARYGPDGERRN